MFITGCLILFQLKLYIGKKTFHTIHLDADSAVKGTVDGVDLSEFKNIALRSDESASLNSKYYNFCMQILHYIKSLGLLYSVILMS